MTIETIKFSEFANGGDLEPNQATVGLDNTSTVNTRFNNPFPLLPPGASGDRPAPSPNMYYRLRFNTTLTAYEFYNPITAQWDLIESTGNLLALLASHLFGQGASLIGLQDQGSVTAKTVQDLANASIVAQTDNGTLVSGFFLSTLPTGIVSVTTTTGDINSRTLTGTANEIDVTNGDGSSNPTFSLSSTLDVPGTFTIQNSIALDEIIDDDSFAAATNTNIPTSESVKAYVDAQTGSGVTSVTGTANEIDVNNTDPQNPVLSLPSTLIAPGTIAVGNLLLNTNTISSTDTNGDLNLTPNGTGDLVLDGLNWPQADGMAGYILSTNGSGQLSFVQETAGNPGGNNSSIQYNNTGAFAGDDNFTTDGSGNIELVTLDIGGSVVVDEVIDDDSFATATDTNIPTSESVKAYVDAQSAIVISTQIFTSGSGTYTPTTGANYVWVRAVGGGGQGGGATSGSGNQGAGGGGGSGGYAEFWEAATSRDYSVGAGGSGGTAGNTGGSGGNTTFGTAGAQISVAGGAGGAANNSASFARALGGAGGAATTGTLLIAGGTGYTGAGATGAVFGGIGASSRLGQGGVGGVAGVNTNGSAATGYGAGGGGGGCAGAAGSVTGGNGSSGVIIIVEYA